MRINNPKLHENNFKFLENLALVCYNIVLCAPSTRANAMRKAITIILSFLIFIASPNSMTHLPCSLTLGELKDEE